MQNPFAGGPLRPDELYAASAARFFELLRACTPPAAGGAGDWTQLQAPLAAQFEQWLRASQSAGPWFAAPGFNPAAGGAPGTAGFAFGPLPLGAAAAPRPEAQRVWELSARLAQLQGQLAAHWGEVARAAAQRFVARAGGAGAPPSLEHSLKLYEVWVACAEEAYAETARREDFCRLQADLANTAAALLVEQRRHAESLVSAFGLPTRNEVDALYAHVKDLSRRLAALEAGPPPRRAAGAPRPQRAAPKRARRGRRRP